MLALPTFMLQSMDVHAFFAQLIASHRVSHMARILFFFAFFLPSITEAGELPRVDVIQLQEQFMTRQLYLDGTLL